MIIIGFLILATMANNVSQQIKGVFQSIGACIMAVINGIAGILKAIVNGIASVLDIIVSCLTCGRGGGRRHRSTV